LVALTYLAAVTVLIVTDLSMWVTLVFPAWVLVVSGLILARSRLIEESRPNHDGPEPSDG
ncbi:MAG TPA: hypothetical protein VMU34_14835, partial [Mycobacterium sp.]|nr:hypothetical protein [Mycobacterium sp.]